LHLSTTTGMPLPLATTFIGFALSSEMLAAVSVRI